MPGKYADGVEPLMPTEETTSEGLYDASDKQMFRLIGGMNEAQGQWFEFFGSEILSLRREFRELSQQLMTGSTHTRHTHAHIHTHHVSCRSYPIG
jgi:hypothetical protein